MPLSEGEEPAASLCRRGAVEKVTNRGMLVNWLNLEPEEIGLEVLVILRLCIASRTVAMEPPGKNDR